MLLQSAGPLRQVDPRSQDVHIHPLSVSVAAREQQVQEQVPAVGTVPGSAACGGAGTHWGAGGKVGFGTCFLQRFLSFSGLCGSAVVPGVGRGGSGCWLPAGRLLGPGWADVDRWLAGQVQWERTGRAPRGVQGEMFC